jgi:iron complex outermembrane receptor protein
VIEDRGLVDLDEFADNVSGVKRARGFGDATGYVIRSFLQTFTTLRNGFPFLNAVSPVGFANVEQIAHSKLHPFVTIVIGGCGNPYVYNAPTASAFG